MDTTVSLMRQEDPEGEAEETIHTCAACEEILSVGQEVFRLMVFRIHVGEHGPYLQDVVDESGEYVYVPYFIDTGCWEEDQISLMDTVHGETPAKALPHLCQCDVCGSSILAGELIGLVEFGRLVFSEQQPDLNEVAVNFHSAGEPYYVCTCCLNVLNVEVRTYWDEDVRNDNECPDGLTDRCWRTGECQHVCALERHYEYMNEKR